MSTLVELELEARAAGIAQSKADDALDRAVLRVAEVARDAYDDALDSGDRRVSSELMHELGQAIKRWEKASHAFVEAQRQAVLAMRRAREAADKEGVL